MSYLMWWPLLKNLHAYAQLQPELVGIDVRIGSKRPKAPYPCIELIWDEEEALNLFRTKEGEFTLFLDCWVQQSDSNPAIGYEAICTMQESLCKVVVEWTDAVLEELDILVDLELSGIVSDGDNHRPLCGSRMVLKMKWKRCS